MSQTKGLPSKIVLSEQFTGAETNTGLFHSLNHTSISASTFLTLELYCPVHTLITSLVTI